MAMPSLEVASTNEGLYWAGGNLCRFVLRAMGYMTEQVSLTSKKQTIAVPFRDQLSYILRHFSFLSFLSPFFFLCFHFSFSFFSFFLLFNRKTEVWSNPAIRKFIRMAKVTCAVLGAVASFWVSSADYVSWCFPNDFSFLFFPSFFPSSSQQKSRSLEQSDHME
jgi:hypothetical protein